jgi:hypothetical protein
MWSAAWYLLPHAEHLVEIANEKLPRIGSKPSGAVPAH